MAENEKAAVEGTVEEVIFANQENGYAVCLVACGDEPVTIVGTLPYLGEGEYIRAVGTWQQHPSFWPPTQGGKLREGAPEGRGFDFPLPVVGRGQGYRTG